MAERVGFSKPISLDLLNEGCEEWIAGLSKREYTERLNAYIGQTVTNASDIRTVRAIVQNVWLNDIDWVHDEAANLARYMTRMERLPLHWSLLLVRYPVFTDLCTILGHLFELKDVVSAKQIKEEIFNKWGARSTLEAALSKNLKSLRDLGTLTRAEKYYSYSKVMHKVSDPKVVALLFAGVMLATEQQYMTWESFITHPAIFPFAITDVTQADMAAVPYFAMERVGEQVVFRVKES